MDRGQRQDRVWQGDRTTATHRLNTQLPGHGCTGTATGTRAHGMLVSQHPHMLSVDTVSSDTEAGMCRCHMLWLRGAPSRPLASPLATHAHQRCQRPPVLPTPMQPPISTTSTAPCSTSSGYSDSISAALVRAPVHTSLQGGPGARGVWVKGARTLVFHEPRVQVVVATSR